MDKIKHHEPFPGPGDYNIASPFGRGPKPIITSRKTPKSIENFPGPCEYSPKILDKSVKYSFRKQSDHSSLIVYPGPASYTPNDIKPKSPATVIGRALRSPKNHETSPGPGCYNLKSSFGSHEFSFNRASRDLLKNDSGPGPADYSPRSSFTLGNSAVLIPRRPATAKHQTPGPGAYETINYSQTSPKWTFTKDTKDPGPIGKSPKQRKRVLTKKKRNMVSESTVFTTHELFDTPKKYKKRTNSHEKKWKITDFSPKALPKKNSSMIFSGKKRKIVIDKNIENSHHREKVFSFKKTKKFKIIKFAGNHEGVTGEVST
jgi:hypothetical protein